MTVQTSHSLLWLLLFDALLLDFAVRTVHVTHQSIIVAARPPASCCLVGAQICFYSLGSALGALIATQLYALSGWYAWAQVSACAFIYWSGMRQ